MPVSFLWRLLWRFKFYCLLIIAFVFAIQIFLAYKSFSLPSLSPKAKTLNIDNRKVFNGYVTETPHQLQLLAAKQLDGDEAVDQQQLVAYNTNNGNTNEANKPNYTATANSNTSSIYSSIANYSLLAKQLPLKEYCMITAKETISAIQRASSLDCRKQIARITCAIQAGKFYPYHLPSYCPHGNHSTNTSLGCYRDEKEFRLLAGYFTNLKNSNTPSNCIQLCLQSGFPYAGVQFGDECYCGNEPPSVTAKIIDTNCNMTCSGNSELICGGNYAMNIYETGIAKFTSQVAKTSLTATSRPVRIAFLLTLNGRALRQVHRLLRALYSQQHMYYIHVDKRQAYLYRQLLLLENDFPNIRLARQRYATIWGGASLLTMLLQCMKDLLQSDVKWDFVINLSESDFPIKPLQKLEEFLGANYDRNFVKSHGRETQRFIQKQGLDKTFIECDTHMWRVGDRKLPTGIQIDGGSDWVALSRHFVEYIINEKDENQLLQGLLVIFRHTLLPAESFFHTVLRNTKFCNTYVDNNLHVTNWKRKLGCKCQYKHVVDWCGCSPNDFKPEDWQRLQNTEQKLLFFARKFEPIVNQAIITRLEGWIYGKNAKSFPNLHGYWHSFYHHLDDNDQQNDLAISIASSLIRKLTTHRWKLLPQRLLELTHYLHKDQYKGYLMYYQTLDPLTNSTYYLETRVRPMQYVKLMRNTKFGKRLKNLEVSSDFDPKEQIFRNMAKFIGPKTDLVCSYTFTGSSGSNSNSNSNINKDGVISYNLTLLWIDPLGRLQDFNNVHIEDSQTDSINYTKAFIKQPITPGIWTTKLIEGGSVIGQARFLIAPLTVKNGHHNITIDEARIMNGDTVVNSYTNDLKYPFEWLQYLPNGEEQIKLLTNLVAQNIFKSIDDLYKWMDEQLSKFHHIRETCIAADSKAANKFRVPFQHLPLCHETTWSSLAPDPKGHLSHNNLYRQNLPKNKTR